MGMTAEASSNEIRSHDTMKQTIINDVEMN